MALTTLPSVGNLRASVLSSLITEVRHLVAYKTANEVINSSTTYQDDNDLTLPVEANASYLGLLNLTWSSGTTPDFKIRLTLPSGGSDLTNWTYSQTAATPVIDNWTPSGGIILQGTAATAVFITSGIITIGSTAGSATWQWAQNVSDGGDTVTYVGSYFELVRFA